MKKLMNLLASLAAALRRVIARAPVEPVVAEPKFLLPETAEEYRRILASLRAGFAAFAKAKREEADGATQYANALEDKARELLAREVMSEAQAELDSREATDLQEKAARLCRTAQMLRTEAVDAGFYLHPEGELGNYPGFTADGRLMREAELRARAWEQDKILAGRVILSTRRRAGSVTVSDVSKSQPDVWDRVDRRITCVGEQFFLISIRAKAVIKPEGTKKGEWLRYRPTGQYEPEVVEFVTPSVGQMTTEELKAIAGYQQ